MESDKVELIAIADNIPVSIAGFSAVRATVAINPSLSEDFNLLGQAYLKLFKMTVQGSTMELTQL